MTFQELIDRVPVEHRHLPVELNVSVGSFPSGEEGAEDWFMGATITGIDIVRPGEPNGVVFIDVDYS